MSTSPRTPKRRARRSSTAGRASRVAASPRVVDIISQLRTAAGNPLAAVLGAAIGGIVPWFAREIAHGELAPAVAAGDWRSAALDLAIVLGCVAFSLVTVYGFGRAAVGDRRKAVGFCLALEGVMLVAHGRPATVALVVLILINAITTGCVIALARASTQRRGEADARRSATRAENRARKAGAGADTASVATSAVAEPVVVTASPAARRTRRPSAQAQAQAQRAIVVTAVPAAESMASWDRHRAGAIDAECKEFS